MGAASRVGTRGCSTRAQGRALLPARRHLRCRATRSRQGYKDVEDPTVYVRFPVTEPAGAAAGRRHAARLDDHAVDAGLQRRRRGRPGADLRRARPTATCSPRRSSRACSASDARVADRFTGAEMVGAALRAAVPLHPGAGVRRQGPHRAAGRLRDRRGRHRHRPHRDRVRRGRLPARRRAGAERRQPGRGRRHLRRADRPVRRPLGQGGRRRPDRGPARARARCCARRRRCTPTRTAGAAARRCSTTPSRPGTSRTQQLKDRLLGRQRDRRLAPGAHQARALRQLAGEQRRLGAVPRALLGHAAARVAQRTAARRSASAPSRSCEAAPASSSTTRTARSSTTSRSPAPTGGERCAACPR